MRERLAIALTVVALGMLAALPAWGHVTVQTDNSQPGEFAVYTVRVPNESDTASTTRIEVQIPADLQASRYQPVPGWTMSIDGGVLTIEGGSIAPGQFQDFRFQARNPEAATDLSFPAIQTYDDGEVVNWTGDPASDTPAAVVEVGASGPEDATGRDWLTLTALGLGAAGVVLGAIAVWGRRRA